MADNQANHGIESDSYRARGSKKGGGRRPFVIETRLVPPPGGWPERSIWRQRFMRMLEQWHVYKRYKTESARDSAYAAVVKQEESKKHLPYADKMGTHEYRLRD